MGKKLAVGILLLAVLLLPLSGAIEPMRPLLLAPSQSRGLAVDPPEPPLQNSMPIALVQALYHH